ncbi:MAG TPA: formyltransferase family protein, partial [Chitinophagaceae bacterium]|nr:formyltransferase family protein [Chitinophagaceae bacterium]
SICFPFIIPEEVLERKNIRFINFHTGPLPAYRGPMPLFEVLRRGEPQTALSVHFMTPDLDEGPVIFQESMKIENRETFGALATRMSRRTALAAHNMAQMLEYASQIPSVPQEEEHSCYYDQPDFSETFIHWKKMTATEAEALVRACNPWNTGADALLMGRHYKIIDAIASGRAHAVPPGTITGFDESGNMCVACKEGQLLVRIFSNDQGIQSAVHMPGKENMIHAAFD